VKVWSFNNSRVGEMEIGIDSGSGRVLGEVLRSEGGTGTWSASRGNIYFLLYLASRQEPCQSQAGHAFEKNNKWDLGAFDMPSSWLYRSD
jgi:hypothetical protein